MKILQTLSIALLFFSCSAWASETTVHRSHAENLQSNGWHLAKSTEGGYSILVPWPFDDATLTTDAPMYTIASRSENITIYSAALAPAGTHPGMYTAFNNDLKNPNLEIGKHQENTSIYGVETVKKQGYEFRIHTKRIKAKSGLYYLMVMVEPQNERLSDIQRFFSSLTIPAPEL